MAFLLGAVCVGTHSLVVQMRHLKEVDRNTAFVSSAKPLRVEPPGSVVLLDIDGLVKGINVILFAPILRVFQLAEGLFGYKLAGSQIAE